MQRITLTQMPESDRSAHAVWMAIATRIGRPLSDVRALSAQLPVVLPLRLEAQDASDMLERLREAGGDGSAEPAEGMASTCAAHRLDSPLLCNHCDAPICTLCVAVAGHQQRCEACEQKARKKRRFYRMRVAFLLSVLAAVLVYAATDVLHRERRKDWSHTLVVAFVFLRLGNVDTEAVNALRDRLPDLEQRLNAELARYRPNAPRMRLLAYGPADVSQPPPKLDEDGLVALAEHNWTLSRYLRDADTHAGFDPDACDARIYLVLRSPDDPERTFVEGNSQLGGWHGLVEVELDDSMIDFSLFVAAHEMFHTLGATDKYDAHGTKIPDGLAEPDLRPMYPQRYVELMARMRPLGHGEEMLPDTLDELRVGPATAREIGWLDR